MHGQADVHALGLLIVFTCARSQRYHGQASDLPNGDVELPEVQRLLAHGGEVADGRAPLLHEVQVSLHPAPPLWLHAKLEEPRDSLSADPR